MAATLLRRFDLALLKVEAVPGTEETPTVGADAVKHREQGTVELVFDENETGEVQQVLDDGLPVPGGGFPRFTLPINVKGSGVAGTEPEADPALKAVGLSRTDQAQHTGTATAGGASSITLAAGASAVDDAYNGMPIDLTGGTGNGQKNLIIDYVGSTKVATVAKPWTTPPDATSVYDIPINDRYQLASTDLTAITAWLYKRNVAAAGQAVRTRVTGARGNAAFRLPRGGLFAADFTFMGKFVAEPDDEPAPSAPTYDSGDPVSFIGADVCHLGGIACNFRELAFDLGNRVVMDDAPTAAAGLDIAEITGRRITGSVNPTKVLVVTNDPFTKFRGATAQALGIRWGATAGKRLAITLTPVQFGVPADEEADGFYKQRIPFRATALYLCFF